jgi:thymidylate synthase (FAD)
MVRELKVLDHGFVRLADHMGSDLTVARAARVSHNADWRPGLEEGSDYRLIRYMMLNNHTSPFEHVIFQFEIQAPLFIFRQWHRHRTWSFNEMSGRYAKLDLGFYVPEVQDITTPDSHNKQARTQVQCEHADEIRQIISGQVQQANRIYQLLLDKGCAKELARSVLPVATYSRMYATVDLHNLMHFLYLRDDPHSQFEMQLYAKALMQLIEPLVPISITAFKEKHGRV